MRHSTAVRCSTRSARRSGTRCGERFSPLEELDRAFLALARTGRVSLPRELLPGEEPGQEEAGEGVGVDQVRAVLTRSATEPQARTRIWREVVIRAQTRGEPWGLVAAGLAVPVLRRVLSRLPRGGVVESAEAEQEVLTAFLTALRAADPLDAEVDRGLVAAADRAAHRHAYAACRRLRLAARLARHDAQTREEQPELVDQMLGNEYRVLRQAVRAGVVTCREARMIARSRLGGESMTALAVEWGMSRRHAFRYRTAAEQRLAAFLKDEPA